MVFLLILPLHQVEYDDRLIMDFNSVLILGDGVRVEFLTGDRDHYITRASYCPGQWCTCVMGHMGIIMYRSRWQTGVMGHMCNGAHIWHLFWQLDIFSHYLNHLSPSQGYFSSFPAKSWQDPASIDIQWSQPIECQCCQDPSRIWYEMSNYAKTRITVKAITWSSSSISDSDESVLIH